MNSFDLPQLSSINCDSASFHKVESLSITSIIIILSLFDVPFINPNLSVKQAFAFIQPDSIISDESIIEESKLNSFNEFEKYDSELLSRN